jgi:hypothetical protein
MQISLTRSGATSNRRQPRHDLRELELVVEVGLEPQRVLAATARRKRAITLFKAPQHLRSGDPAAGQVLGAHRAQPRVVDVGHRPLVQRAAPDDAPLDQPRLAERLRGRVAVGDVQRPHAATSGSSRN